MWWHYLNLCISFVCICVQYAHNIVRWQGCILDDRFVNRQYLITNRQRSTSACIETITLNDSKRLTTKNVPIRYAGRQYARHINAGRRNIVIMFTVLKIWEITQHQTQFVVHRPFDFNQKRTHWKFNALHYRHIIFYRQICVARHIATFQYLLCVQQCFIDEWNLLGYKIGLSNQLSNI